MSTDGKVVIVTGGARGLGLGIVEELLARDSSVATCSRHPSDAIRRLEQEAGGRFLWRACQIGEPAEEEVAAELHISIEEYHRWLTDVRGVDIENLQYVGGDGEVDLLQFIADDEDNLPSRQFERSELEHVVAEGITRMPKQERTVLSLYYQQELNIRQIAEIMQIHISRVSQLKSQAILRLKAYLSRRLSVQPKALNRQRIQPVAREVVTT